MPYFGMKCYTGMLKFIATSPQKEKDTFFLSLKSFEIDKILQYFN